MMTILSQTHESCPSTGEGEEGRTLRQEDVEEDDKGKEADDDNNEDYEENE